MLASLVNSARNIGDYAYYLAYGHELSGTPANLKWALQQAPQDVLKYSFKEQFHTYSILEYAVKCGDAAAVKALFQLGAEARFSEASWCMGNIVHFYIEDLEEEKAPNLDVLNLLLDELFKEDINDESGGNFQTALEYALKEMSDYRSMHWGVIITLLDRGVRITSENGSTPSQVLQATSNWKSEGCSPLDIQRDVKLLRHLVVCRALEKKYYPDTQSGLTLEEFKVLIPGCIALFNQGAISMMSVPFTADVVRSLSGMSKKVDAIDEKDSITQEQLEEYERAAQTFQDDFFRNISADYKKFEVVAVYHWYFTNLVKSGEFKDCFEKSALKSVVSALQCSNMKDSLYLMSQFKQMGLLPPELDW